MIARANRWVVVIATMVASMGGVSASSACDSCNGGRGGQGGRSYSAFSEGDYSYGHDAGGGCSSCGSARCRDASCYNEPSGCRDCPPNPDKVDCCNPCSRKRVFGCGWRTWDWLGYWSCGGGCADGQGCGEIYRGDYASDPPVCCDPCDGHGNWIGPGSGYRARYNPTQYVGGDYYESSSDFSYSSNETYQEPARIGSVVRSRPSAAPSRLVPSTTRTTSAKPSRSAWQTQRTMTR